jgi:multidrug resistance efflux pump
MTELDQRRVKAAMDRAETALRNAKHHDRQAKAERAKAETLARTWGFKVEGYAVKA